MGVKFSLIPSPLKERVGVGVKFSLIPSPLRGRVRVGVKFSHKQPRLQRTMANPVNRLILQILIGVTQLESSLPL